MQPIEKAIKFTNVKILPSITLFVQHVDDITRFERHFRGSKPNWPNAPFFIWPKFSNSIRPKPPIFQYEKSLFALLATNHISLACLAIGQTMCQAIAIA